MKIHLVRRISLSFFLLLLVGAAKAQQYQAYHQLTANDFWGSPRANERGVVAYTNCTIDFKYQVSNHNGNYALNALVTLVLNNNRSWLDRGRVTSQDMLTEILKHEQGHYMIAYLELQEVLRQVNKTRFSRNYQYEARNLFDRIDARYKQLNTDYDEDTAHMTNRQQQHSWDLYFQKRLAYMPQD